MRTFSSEFIISRRVFIGSAMVLVAAPILAGTTNTEKELLVISNSGQFFSAEHMTMLADIAEIMIPISDTAGATDAHVIPVLDAMMLTWAVAGTKKQFLQLLVKLNEIAKASFQTHYLNLGKDERVALVSQLDKRAFANQTSELSKSYRKLKKIIFHIYYTSEPANPDFMLIPGTYRGCVTQAELDTFNARGRVS
ncbi:gluconate 2-dehydrogenase subunit 3 family protein [Thalassotalea litorea]|uniref:gluconate 2-dehydrogenase subunit 3 family protein n=1 Tax=Thalassotalea litorea TaxID=2020715 RepID=UPI003735C696